MKAAQEGKPFFVFDLDGTVLNEELIPKIAEHLMPSSDMSSMTRLAISGEIPYESSLRERVRSLSMFPIETIQQICMNAAINNDILEFIREHRSSCAIVSSNLDVWIAPLIQQRIGVPWYGSKADVENGKVAGIKSVIRKEFVVQGLLSKKRCCVAVGDGHNDQTMLARSTVSIAFSGIRMPAPSLYDVADYVVCNSKTLCRLLRLL